MKTFEPLTAPEFDDDNYPTEATLETIRQWDWRDLKGLFKFLHAANIYSDCGYCHLSEDGQWLQFSTGGWSGNESLISAMQEGERGWKFGVALFAHCRGGHYLFGCLNAKGFPDLLGQFVSLMHVPVEAARALGKEGE